MERLLSNPRSGPLIGAYGRAAVKRAASRVIRGTAAVDPEEILAACARELAGRFEPDPVRVVNATGVLIHTNLGRAPLSESARRAIGEAAAGYQSVEIDLETGRRGSRGKRLRELLASFLGTEDALVVNNNAAAVLLALSAAAAGREVLVSRGELVAIGGSFKIPEILELSGARLREVGTTNRTKLEDYERAFSKNTAALLTVHPSNYEIRGYFETAGARRRRDPRAEEENSLDPTITAPETRSASMSTASAGKKRFPTRSPRGPRSSRSPATSCSAARRPGSSRESADGSRPAAPTRSRERCGRTRLTLAGLFATVADWITRGPEAIPIHALAGRPVEELRARAEAVRIVSPRISAETIDTLALRRRNDAGAKLPLRRNRALELVDLGRRAGRRLRAGKPPIVGGVERGKVTLDFRTIFPEEDETVSSSLRAILSSS